MRGFSAVIGAGPRASLLTVISVVIPVRDAAHVLPGQLAALAAQAVDEPWEVLIADNGSTDELADVVADWKDRLPGLRVVDASDRPGASHARNVGARAARGDRILFCDADDEVGAGWIRALGTALRDHVAVGGVQDHRRFNPPGRIRPGTGYTEELIRPHGFAPITVGSNCGFRAEVLAEVGGYDETFLVGEDAELAYRLQERGYDLTFVPEAVCHYRERPTTWSLAKQRFIWGREDPHLYQRFARAGMPPSGFRRGLRAWAHLIVYGPRYWRTRSERTIWVRVAAVRIGRIAGSVRYRTVYL
jgi:cellulose synthase/poly-beta-1,6-N-acetylglucosamine synthase-like glycosyltransferase